MNPTADVLPEADLKLAGQLVRLSDSQLADPEASFYAGITTIGLLYQVESTEPSLVHPHQAAHFVADATRNIAVGLAGMDPYEQVQAAKLLAEGALFLGDAVGAPIGFAHTFVDTAVQTLSNLVQPWSLAADPAVPASQSPLLHMVDHVFDAPAMGSHPIAVDAALNWLSPNETTLGAHATTGNLG